MKIKNNNGESRVKVTHELLEHYISGVEPSENLIDKAKELGIDYDYIREQVEKEEAI